MRPPRPPRRADGRGALALAAALLGACVTRSHRPTPPSGTAALGTPELIQEVVRQALLLDAAGSRAADTVTLEGRFAWVMVDYRWINSQQNQAEAGRATFVCEEKPRGWKIVHVHSSQVLPWDR